MRPLELTIDGFRSYRGPTTFDWRDRRLVGIVGPIGAGKSSILDALAFALYGRTPGVGAATKSLIHQLCDEAHVSLTFEVDGQVWQAIRAPKRKGQSGHQLRRLGSDRPDAEVLETVAQEGQVNDRIQQLLGMDFQTFCRSVLLAQNRFSDFLKATKSDRDKVLKGVFGYERLDAAKVAAERRVDKETAALEGFARERESIHAALERLEDAQARAEEATRRLKSLEGAAPEVARLTESRMSAEAAAGVAATEIESIGSIAARMPEGPAVDATLEGATASREAVDASKDALKAAEEARTTCDAELVLVREQLGDRDQLRSFERLVERHDELAKTSERAVKAHSQARSTAIQADELLEQRRMTAAEASEALARADDRLIEGAAATADARGALAAAKHTEMAHELRGQLVAGEPCPVCAQEVATLPKRTSAPKGVAVAEKTLVKAVKSETALRKEKEGVAAAMGSATTAVAEAEVRVGEAGARLEETEEEMRHAEAELTAAKDQLTERLGDGEPRELVAARESELADAEGAAERAASAVDAARRSLEAEREKADEAQMALTALASDLAGVWGALGSPRTLAAEPIALRSAFVEGGEELLERHRRAAEAASDATARATASAEALSATLASLGLDPEEDFVAAKAAAAAAHAASVAVIDELETQIARSGDLERQMLETEARRTLARKLSDDLKPSKFLAYLLQEEREELAELGSGLFETLTDGGYRFAADDSFDILDLNAADRKRKADSLSGGETFLASLALALALAEIVARGGGRLDAFFLDEGFGSLDQDHLDRAMAGIGNLVAADTGRLVVLVSHVAEMREAIEDLVILDKDARTGDTVVVSGAALEGDATFDAPDVGALVPEA